MPPLEVYTYLGETIYGPSWCPEETRYRQRKLKFWEEEIIVGPNIIVPFFFWLEVSQNLKFNYTADGLA